MTIQDTILKERFVDVNEKHRAEQLEAMLKGTVYTADFLQGSESERLQRAIDVLGSMKSVSPKPASSLTDFGMFARQPESKEAPANTTDAPKPPK